MQFSRAFIRKINIQGLRIFIVFRKRMLPTIDCRLPNRDPGVFFKRYD